VKVIGVQPRGNCAMHESLGRGSALTIYEGSPTIAEGCDGAIAESTFALCRAHGVSIALVDEADIRAALGFAYTTLGISIEPTAAVAIAGLRTGAVSPAARGATAVIVSGGNVDPELLSSVAR
jgi:threonine dehydratase